MCGNGLPWGEWFLDGGVLDLDQIPPVSRERFEQYARARPGQGPHRSVLSWLESHGRRVVNGRRVLELEMSKALESALDTGQLDQPADHTWLLQDYLDPVGGFITRIEVVGAGSWW